MKALKLNPTLTLADAKRQVKAMGLTLVRKADTDEYVVKSPDGGTYHTDDLADAVNTARDLSGRPAVMGGKSSRRNPHGQDLEYVINLDERGEFFADVRRNGETIFEIHGTEIFEDGFMRHKHDVAGLEEYLRDLKVIGSNESIASSSQSPRFAGGKAPHRNPPLRDNVYLATVRMARGKHRYFGAFAEFDEVIKQPGAGHVVTYVLNVAGDRLILQNVTPEGIYHFRSEDGATFTGEKVSAEEVKAKIADAVSLESPEDYYHDQNLPRKASRRNPPKPGTYAGGVGFWRKSIGLAEGAPKHLVPRPKHTTDVDYVEYVRPLAGEPVFELGGNRYQYVVGRYPSGREDIAVYSYAGDVTHGYAFFRRMLNLT